MAYEQKNGDIVVYAVKEKKNERGPDFTGKALIDGVEKDVSMWRKSDTMFAGQIKDKWKPSQHDQDKANGYQPDIKKTFQQPLEDDSEVPF